VNKEEAITKVRKLQNQAKGTNSSHEAETARKLADELMKKHGLVERDLVAPAKVLAFEELLAELESLSRSKELPPAVSEALGMLKKNMTNEEKTDALEKIVAIVRVGSLFFGKKMRVIKDVVEATLQKHEVAV
jgi:hypothetical protein